MVLSYEILCYCLLKLNSLGIPVYANFPKLFHPFVVTILSAAVSVYYIFDTRPLCINFYTHLIEYVNYLLPVIRIRAATA